ncbi:MAG: hypothetical protein CMJ18_15055 [Phycisphaeraceae bacterium]|nr:hypothetical protein [Phycisphaeraceae bacterium]
MNESSDNSPGRLVKRVGRVLGVWGTNAQYRYFECVEACPSAARWLDVGCGRRIVPEWMVWEPRRCRDLLARFGLRVGVDVPYMSRNDEVQHRVAARIEKLAMADAAFGLITANMVVEHVEDPEEALVEVRRVLSSGGRFVFHTPNLLYPSMLLGHAATLLLPQKLKNRLVGAIEGRNEGDVFPTRYRCNTRGRIRRLARRAGLEVERLETVESIPSSLRSAQVVAVAELIFMWIVRMLRLSGLRSNLVVVLRKP